MKAAIYVRISKDRDRDDKDLDAGRDGVKRQLADCLALAEARHHTVIEVYEDNDISASRYARKRRPNFERMIADAKAGKFGLIVAYTSSRITRRPMEFERLIELAERHGIRFEYVKSPSFNLRTADGREIARMLANRDAGESERIGERVRRTLTENAKEGKPHGGQRPYGWSADRTSIVDSEAEVIRECVDRILRGETFRSLVADLNARGIASATGKLWAHQSLRHSLLNHRHAGLRVHRTKGDDGEPVETVTEGTWPAIVDRDRWLAFRRMVTDKARVTTPGRAGRVHLLSKLATCAICGQGLTVGKHKDVSMYRCPGGHVGRNQAKLDELVTSLVVGYLAERKASDLFPIDDDDAERAAAEVDAQRYRDKLAEAKAAYLAEEMSFGDWRDARSTWETRLADAEARAARPALDRDRIVGEIVGARAYQVWAGWSVELRRACIKAVLDLRVGRGRKGPRFTTAGLEESRWVGDPHTFGDHLRLFGIGGGYLDVTTVEVWDEETGTYGPAKPRELINPETIVRRAPDSDAERTAFLRALTRTSPKE